MSCVRDTLPATSAWLGLRAVARAVQFLARGEEGERLQHLRAGLEEFAVQLAERVRIFHGHFRRELAAAFARANFFTARTAVHIAASFQFDEITTVPEEDAFFQHGSDRFHVRV